MKKVILGICAFSCLIFILRAEADGPFAAKEFVTKEESEQAKVIGQLANQMDREFTELIARQKVADTRIDALEEKHSKVLSVLLKNNVRVQEVEKKSDAQFQAQQKYINDLEKKLQATRDQVARIFKGAPKK